MKPSKKKCIFDEKFSSKQIRRIKKVHTFAVI